MQFDAYADLTAETAIYPEAGQGTALALAYVGLGLSSEAGEVAGKIKKIIRDDNGNVSEEKAAALAAEVGDVLWYAARIAQELNRKLDDLAAENVDKLLGRKARGTIGGSGDIR